MHKSYVLALTLFLYVAPIISMEKQDNEPIDGRDAIDWLYKYCHEKGFKRDDNNDHQCSHVSEQSLELLKKAEIGIVLENNDIVVTRKYSDGTNGEMQRQTLPDNFSAPCCLEIDDGHCIVHADCHEYVIPIRCYDKIDQIVQELDRSQPLKSYITKLHNHMCAGIDLYQQVTFAEKDCGLAYKEVLDVICKKYNVHIKQIYKQIEQADDDIEAMPDNILNKLVKTWMFAAFSGC